MYTMFTLSVLACVDEQFADLDAGVCYLFEHTSVPWTTARTNCVNKGGQLATFPTQAQLQVYHSMRSSQTDESM